MCFRFFYYDKNLFTFSKIFPSFVGSVFSYPGYQSLKKKEKEERKGVFFLLFFLLFLFFEALVPRIVFSKFLSSKIFL